MYNDLTDYLKGDSVHLCLILLRNLAKRNNKNNPASAVAFQSNRINQKLFIKTAYVQKEQAVIHLPS